MKKIITKAWVRETLTVYKKKYPNITFVLDQRLCSSIKNDESIGIVYCINGNYVGMSIDRTDPLSRIFKEHNKQYTDNFLNKLEENHTIKILIASINAVPYLEQAGINGLFWTNENCWNIVLKDMRYTPTPKQMKLMKRFLNL